MADENTRNRWFLTSHVKATIAAEVELMTQKKNHDERQSDHSHHTDNSSDQKQSKEWPTTLCNFFTTNNINPFVASETTTIFNLISGLEISQSNSLDIFQAIDKAEECTQEIMRDRLEEGKKSILTP